MLKVIIVPLLKTLWNPFTCNLKFHGRKAGDKWSTSNFLGLGVHEETIIPPDFLLFPNEVKNLFSINYGTIAYPWMYSEFFSGVTICFLMLILF